MMYYSGCNYYVNRGNNEYEPIGTATSMHDCDGCEKLDFCLLKKETDVWPYNEEIRKKMDLDWKSMHQKN